MAVTAKDGTRPWEPFGVTEADFAVVPEHDGVRVVNVTPDGEDPGQAGWWLRGAAIALAVLAAAAAGVSWDAQFTMVVAVKHHRMVAALEAGIPDVGAVVFAALGVALALHGKRAVRPRVLNAACVGISLEMNALAAGHGWRDLAIWVMPAGVYALASDTLIGVVRAWVLARAQHCGETLADDGPTPLAALGSVLLWLLRLALAFRSTLTGFRAWVVRDCPVAPRVRPGHLAELAAVRREAEQRIALAAGQQAQAAGDAAAQVRQAREDATRAQAAEATVGAELNRVRADATQQTARARADAAREREELRTWAERQTGALRAEMQQMRDEAAQLLDRAWQTNWLARSATARARHGGSCCGTSASSRPGPYRANRSRKERRQMADRRREASSTGEWAAAMIAAGVAGVVAVRWLASLNWAARAGIATGVVALLLWSWAVMPSRRLPRNRVRHMRLRARLRLHPGRGHATVFELWLRWGRLAAARRARRSRPSLPLAQRLACPAQTSVLVVRAHYNHACRVPVEEHVIYISPPRAGKMEPSHEPARRHTPPRRPRHPPRPRPACQGLPPP